MIETFVRNDYGPGDLHLDQSDFEILSALGIKINSKNNLAILTIGKSENDIVDISMCGDLFAIIERMRPELDSVNLDPWSSDFYDAFKTEYDLFISIPNEYYRKIQQEGHPIAVKIVGPVYRSDYETQEGARYTKIVDRNTGRVKRLFQWWVQAVGEEFVVWRNNWDPDLIIEISSNGLIEKARKLIRKDGVKTESIEEIEALQEKIKISVLEQDSIWR